MQQFIDNLISRLEEESKFALYLSGEKTNGYVIGCCDTNKKTIRIVNQLAEEYKPRTNADKVKTMTNAELAVCMTFCPVTKGKEDCIHNNDDVPCVDCILDWLQSEVKDGE